MFKTTNFLKPLLILSIFISVVASIYFSSSGSSLLYRDAKSHLNIAKRVFSSQTPGVAQLGGIWLPLPHILMLPTIWLDFFYYSGLSGIIPSMISFIIVVLSVYGIIYLYSQDSVASFIGSSTLLTNPSLLYLQSTPMSELPLFATSCASIYFLCRWSKDREYFNLVFSSGCIFLATLARYDAWFLLVCEIIVVFLITIFSPKKNQKIEGNLFLFTMLGGFGIFLWGLYNKLIFGKFLNFALGQGSAAWDTKRVTASSDLSSKMNFTHSFLTYFWMAWDNIGMVLIIGAILGFLLYFLFRKNKSVIIPAFLLMSPFVFNVISLFLGLSIGLSIHLAPFQTYNLRYGSGVLPAIAFFIGIFASKSKLGKLIAISLLLIQLYLFYSQPLEILADANVGNIKAEVTIANWVREHPSGGNTLLSTLAHDPLLFEAHIPMKKLIYEGNQYLWESALSFPEGSADRIILKKSDTTNDTVRKRLYNSKALKEKYSKVYDDGDYQIYDRKSTS